MTDEMMLCRVVLISLAKPHRVRNRAASGESSFRSDVLQKRRMESRGRTVIGYRVTPGSFTWWRSLAVSGGVTLFLEAKP